MCYISGELPQDSMGIQGRTGGGGVSLSFKGAQHMARARVGVGVGVGVLKTVGGGWGRKERSKASL